MPDPKLPPITVDDDDLDIDYTPEHPQTQDPSQRLDQIISKDDRDKLVAIITSYRAGWGPDRLLRIPEWTRNILMRRGKQFLAWDSEQGAYFDYLDWYRTSGKMQDGDDSRLERYANNITRKACKGFVATISRGIPPTAIFPEDAEIEADVSTATFGQEAISIIERMNDINRLVRQEATTLYDGGMYVKHTRTVVDGTFAGYDEEPVFDLIPQEKPDRYHCSCGMDTQAVQGRPAPMCDRCGKQLGSADFYPAEQGEALEGIVGTRKVPRAMVRFSIHGPLEFDADPQANDLKDSAIKALDREIDSGAARRAFPALAQQIKEGQASKTDPNADYSRLRRNEVYSKGYAYTSDTFQQRVTYSQCWMEPESYYREECEDKDGQGMTFTDRMMALGPEGLKVTMMGEEVVDVRPCNPSDELSVCLLEEGCGLYPPAIADDVVSFNERLNNNMNIIDDYFERCATGIAIFDTQRIDREKLKGRVFTPGEFVGVSTKGEGMQRPLEDSLYQFQFQMDQKIMEYPAMIVQMSDTISGITAQLTGVGTQKGVETAKGQQLQTNLSEASINVYWENLKAEHAKASQNALKALQKAHEDGLIEELWDVLKSNDSEFRNNTVDLNKLNGRIRVYPEIDEGLPQSPEQKRQGYQDLLVAAGGGNEYAKSVVDVPTNAKNIMSSMYGREIVLPKSKQQERTLQHISILLSRPGQLVVGPQGTLMPDLPVKPEIGTDDWETAKDTIKLFKQENWDQRAANPEGWARLDAYVQLLLQLQTQEAIDDAQRHAKVQQSVAPQPDPKMQAAKEALMADAQAAIERNAAIGGENPALLAAGKMLGPVVSANSKIIDAAMKAATQ